MRKRNAFGDFYHTIYENILDTPPSNHTIYRITELTIGVTIESESNSKLSKKGNIHMNQVFKQGSTIPLTPQQLADEANIITGRRPFSASDFTGSNSRIQGAGHCNCDGNGEFELLSIWDPDVQASGKRYMQCRKCGGWSHL